jgi:transcriptional regulator
MHPAPAFAWDDRAAALAFVAEVSFAHVFLQTPAGPRVAHVPVLVAGETLRFHLANGNALTPVLDGATALASIGGPGHYVSPNWYADGRSQVPTWNYIAVECEGPVRRLSGEELVDLLDATTAIHEARVGEDWTRAKMDPRRFAAMCGAITGFELGINTIRATRKLSQNKGEADVRGVIAGLQATGQESAAALLMADRGW